MSATAGPAVATGGSDDSKEEEFSIKVERFEEIGADYVWTLRLKGFEKNQWIYIYDKDKQLKGSGGCKIVDLDAQEVRVKASLFDLCEQVNYTFRLVKFHVCILLLYCLYSTYIYTYIYIYIECDSQFSFMDLQCVLRDAITTDRSVMAAFPGIPYQGAHIRYVCIGRTAPHDVGFESLQGIFELVRGDTCCPLRWKKCTSWHGGTAGTISSRPVRR
jgi:hypothetical protein